MTAADPMSRSESADFEIAVIAMAAIFPGSPTVERFWDNLLHRRDLITRTVPDPTQVDERLLGDPDVVFAGGRIDGARQFDADFFGFSARDASFMDPQQRKLLEIGWHALEAAGVLADPWAAPSADDPRIGVYAGSGQNRYLLSHVHPRSADDRLAVPAAQLGNLESGLATRISYELGLTGPSMTIRTACSTSLVAIHTACQDLLSFGCDIALAGGVSIDPSAVPHYRYIAGAPMSHDGRCRPFDADADGSVPSDGAGMVVLRRLSDAIADGDRIRAVIKGSAVNNDGRRKVGFTAPSSHGQREVIVAAQTAAGVEPEQIGFVEAHGTATPVGDPIEVRALIEAFGGPAAPSGEVLLGAVKGNIGHTDAAAGVAGFIKTVLAVESGTVPPTANFARPNPIIDFSSSPFRVNVAAESWPIAGERIAGVSSFGVGGTNAHVIVAAPPKPRDSRGGRAHQVITLSARSGAALAALERQTRDRLGAGASTPDQLADLAFSLSRGRGIHTHRRALVASTDGSVAAAGGGRRDNGSRTVDSPPPPVVFVFPGTGGQDCAGIREIHAADPVFREAFDACARIHARHRPGVDLLEHVTTHGVGFSRREHVPDAGVGLLAIEYGLGRSLISHGVSPTAMVGYSAGEYAAALLSGVLGPQDAVRLVLGRSDVIAASPPGATVSIHAAPEAIDRYLDPSARGDRLDIAGVNTPDWCLVAGPLAAIRSLEAALDADGIEYHRLPVRAAGHSWLLDAELGRLAEVTGTITAQPPALPYVSCSTGRWIAHEDLADGTYWSRHLREPVRFDSALRTALSAGPSLVLEVGPGAWMSSVIAKHPVVSETVAVVATQPAAAPGYPGILGALATCWELGVSVRDLPHAIGVRNRVSVPGYPFASSEYWLDEVEPGVAHRGTSAESGTDYRGGWRLAAVPRAVGIPGDDVRVVDLGAGPIDVDEAAGRLHAQLGTPDQPATIVVTGTGLFDPTAAEFATDDAYPVEAMVAAVSALPGCGRCLLLDLHGIDDAATITDIIAAEIATAETTVVRTPSQRWVRCRIRPSSQRRPEGRGAAFSDDRLIAEIGRARSAENDAIAALPAQRPGSTEREIDELCRLLLHEFLRSTGIDIATGTVLSLDDVHAALGAAPRWHRFIGALLGLLAADGDLVIDADRIRFLRDLSPAGTAGDAAARIIRADPAAAAEVELLVRIAAGYPAVFAEQVDQKEVLFPDGHVSGMRELVERKLASTFLPVYQPILIDMVGALAAAAHRPLRVLEIGSGRGHLTWPLLAALRNAGPVEYHVTDIGRSFVVESQARVRAAGDFGDVRFGVLDIAEDPARQGYAVGSFDLVLALNVIHAVPNLRAAVDNAISLTAPGGVFALLEGYRMPRPAVLVAGLYEGWWYFDDDIRADSPLIDPESWGRLLAEFDGVTVTTLPDLPDDVARADTTLVLARRERGSDGAESGEVRIAADALPDPLGEEWWLQIARRYPRAERVVITSAAPDDDADGTAVPRFARRAATISRGCAAGNRAGHSLWTHVIGGDGRGRLPDEHVETLYVPPPDDADSPASQGNTATAGHPELFNRRPNLATAFVAPRGGIEEVVAGIWREVLGLDRVGVHDDLVDLGGESLMVMQIASRVRRRYGVPMAMRDVFAAKTVGELSTLIDGRRTSPTAALTAETAETITPSPRRGRRVWRAADGRLLAAVPAGRSAAGEQAAPTEGAARD
ncbi:type I polyketide synthase [Millisia brevis]|uniref:type I polyketide synthase n=1 Tax=Millisia brevis TaxID=264148 RepID=UPI00082E54BA|nr:type I polyketide synthase [Millisia brevis]